MDETTRSLIVAFTALALMAGVVIGVAIGRIVDELDSKLAGRNRD
jgi:hypothetical protein